MCCRLQIFPPRWQVRPAAISPPHRKVCSSALLRTDGGPGGSHIQYTLLSGAHKAHGDITCVIAPLMQHSPAVSLMLQSAPPSTQSAVLQVRLARGALLATARPVRKRVDKVQWCELVTRTGSNVGSVLVSFRPHDPTRLASPPEPSSSPRRSGAAAPGSGNAPGLTRDALPVWVREVLGQLPSGAEMGAARVRHRLVDYAAIVTDTAQPWAAMQKRHSSYTPPRNNPQVLWRWPPPPTVSPGADLLSGFSDSEDDEESLAPPVLPPTAGHAQREISSVSASSRGSADSEGTELTVSGDHGDLPFPDMLHWWVFGDAGQNNRTRPGSVLSFPLHTGTPHEDSVLWGVAMELPRCPATALAAASVPLDRSPRLRFVLLTRSQHVAQLSMMLQSALRCDQQHRARGAPTKWVVPQVGVAAWAHARGARGEPADVKPKLDVRHQHSASEVLHSTPAPGGVAGHVPEAFATTDTQHAYAGTSAHLGARLRAPVMASGMNALTGSRLGLGSAPSAEDGPQVKANAQGRVMYVTQASAPSSPKGTRERRGSSVSRSAFAGAAASAAGHDDDPSFDEVGAGVFETPRFGNAPLYVPWADTESGTVEHSGDGNQEDGRLGSHRLHGPLQFAPPRFAEHWVRWLALAVPQPSSSAKLRVAIPLPCAIERYWADAAEALERGDCALPAVQGRDMVSLLQQAPGDFPPSPLTLQPLGGALSASVILQGMECLLRERHVLVVGPCAQQVSAVTHGLASLLYPLRWALPHVPLLPKNILEQGDHLESPVPFLYGVTSHALRACMQPVSAADTAASRRRAARDIQLARLCDSPGSVAFLLGLSASPVMNVAGVSCAEMFAEMACPGRIRRRATVGSSSPTARDKRSTAATAALKEVDDIIHMQQYGDGGSSAEEEGPEAGRRRAETNPRKTRTPRADSVDTFAQSSVWSSMGQGGSSLCHAYVLDLEHGCFVRGGLRGWALQLAAAQQWVSKPPHECECQLTSSLPLSSDAARAIVRGVGRQNPLPVGFRSPTHRGRPGSLSAGGRSPKRDSSADNSDAEGDAAFGVLASQTLESPTRRRVSVHTRLGDGTGGGGGGGFPASTGAAAGSETVGGVLVDAQRKAQSDSAAPVVRRTLLVAATWDTCFPKPLATGFIQDVQHLLRAAGTPTDGGQSFPWGPQHDRAIHRLALRLMWHTLRGLNDATWVPGGASIAAARFAQTKRAELEWAQNTEHPSVSSLPYISRAKLADCALFLHRVAASQAMARFLEHHSGTHSRMAWLQLLQLACDAAAPVLPQSPGSPPSTPQAASAGTRRKRLSVELPSEHPEQNHQTDHNETSVRTDGVPTLTSPPVGNAIWSPIAVPNRSGDAAAEGGAGGVSPNDSAFIVRGFTVAHPSSPVPRGSLSTGSTPASFDVGGWLTEVARIAGDVPRPTPAMALSFSHWFVQLMHEEVAVKRSAQTAKLAPPSPINKPGGGGASRPRAHLMPSCDWEATAAYLPAMNGGIELGAMGPRGDRHAYHLRIDTPAYTAYVPPPLPAQLLEAVGGGHNAPGGLVQAWGAHVFAALGDHEAHVRMEAVELQVVTGGCEGGGDAPPLATEVARTLANNMVWDAAIVSGLCTGTSLVAGTDGQSPHLLIELLRSARFEGPDLSGAHPPAPHTAEVGTAHYELLLSQPVPVSAAEGAISEQLVRAAVYASVAGADKTPIYSIMPCAAQEEGSDYSSDSGSQSSAAFLGGPGGAAAALPQMMLAITADSLLDSTCGIEDSRSGHDELVLTALSAVISCPSGPMTVAQVLPSPWEVEQPVLVTVSGGDTMGNTPFVTPCPAALAASARMHATDIALPVLAMSRHLVARQPAVRTLVSLLSAACAPPRAALRQQMAADHSSLSLRDTMDVLRAHAVAGTGTGDGADEDRSASLQQARLSAAVRLRLKAQAARIRATTHVEGQGTDDELPEIHPQSQAVSAGDPLGSRAAPLSSDLADSAMRAIESFGSPQGRSAFVQMLQQHVLVLRGYSRPAACGAIPATARMGTGAAPIAPDPNMAGLETPSLESPEWGMAVKWITRHPTAYLLPELGPGVFGSSSTRGAPHGTIKLWPPSAAALAVVARVLLSLSAAEGDYDTAAALLQVCRHFSTPLDGLWVAAAAASAREWQASSKPRTDSDFMEGATATATFSQLQESAKTCLTHAPWPVLLTHCCPVWDRSASSEPAPAALTAILLNGTPRPGQGLSLQTALVGEASPSTAAPQFWDAVMRSVFAEHMRSSEEGGTIETPPADEALGVKSETLSSLFLEQLHAMVVAGALRSVLAAWVAVLPLHEAQVISLEAALTQVTTSHAALLRELAQGDNSAAEDDAAWGVQPGSAATPPRAAVRARSATAAPDLPVFHVEVSSPEGSQGDSAETASLSVGTEQGGAGGFNLGQTATGSSSPKVRQRASSAVARRIARELLLPGADVTVAHSAISLYAPPHGDDERNGTHGNGIRALNSSVPAFTGAMEGSLEDSPMMQARSPPLSPLALGTSSPLGGTMLPATPVARDPLMNMPTSPWAANDAVSWWTHLPKEEETAVLGGGELVDRLQWIPLRSVMGALAKLRQAEEGAEAEQQGVQGGGAAPTPPLASPLLRGFGSGRRMSGGALSVSARSSPGSDTQSSSHSTAATAGGGGAGGVSSGVAPTKKGPPGVSVLVDTPWRAKAPPLSPLDLQLLCHSVTLADAGTAVTVLAGTSGGAARLPRDESHLPPRRHLSHTREVLLAGSSSGACVLWDVTRNTAVGAPWKPHAGSVTGAVLLTLAASDSHDPLAPPSAYAIVTAGQGGGVCVSLHSAGNTEHSLFLGLRSTHDGTPDRVSRGVPPLVATPRDGISSFGERFATGVTYLPDAPGSEPPPTRRGSIGARLKSMFKKKGGRDGTPVAGSLACSCLASSWLTNTGSDAGTDCITPPPSPYKPTLQVAAGFADGTVALWRVTLRTSQQSNGGTPIASPAGAGAAVGFKPENTVDSGSRGWRGLGGGSGSGPPPLGWTASAHAVILCQGGHDMQSPPQGLTMLTLARGTAPVVVSWGRDGTVCIWCSQTGALLNAWRAHTRAVIAACAIRSPYTGGAIIATGSLDGHVHVWALTSMATSAVSKPPKHSGSQQPSMASAVVNSVSVQHTAALNCKSPIWSLAMSHAQIYGRLVVVAGADNGCVFCWAFHAVTPSATILGSWAVRRAHTAAVTALDLHSPVGLVASGSEDASVMLLDLTRLLGRGGQPEASGGTVTWEAPPVLPEDGGNASDSYVACPVEAVWSTHDMEELEEQDEGVEGGGAAAHQGMTRSSSQRSSRALQGCKACHMSQVAAVRLLPGAVASVSWDGTLRVWHALSSAVRDAGTTHQAERAAMAASMQRRAEEAKRG